MDKDYFDIGDNEIRILSAEPKEGETEKPVFKRLWWLWLVLALTVIVFIMMMQSHPLSSTLHPSPVTNQQSPATHHQTTITYQAPDEVEAYTQFSCDTINDIALQIYTPIGGQVELHVGLLPDNDSTIILATQAADYRADNGQIAGAFVYRGELLARGHPKYGFCAIIGNKLTMGMSPETSLFERAVEQGGYFFRQFSLVHDGHPGESLPKGKAVRRALCYHHDNIVIIETMERESLHDFAQALMDMGVREALSLVGSIHLPLYVNKEGQRITQPLPHWEKAQETYIVWRK